MLMSKIMRNEAADFLCQLIEYMNEMRKMTNSIKEITKRLKRINYCLFAFLIVIRILEGIKYVIRKNLCGWSVLYNLTDTW